VNPVAIRLPIVVLLAAAAVLAGCTDDEPSTSTSSSSPPSPAASPSVDVEQGQARTQILTVYTGYQQAVMAASLKGDYQAKALAQYTAEPLLGQTRNSIYQIKQAGLVNKGVRRWSPQITDIQLDGTPPTATIEDCTDTSEWIVVSRKTDKPVPAPSGRPTKYLVTSTAKKVSGKWYIAESKGDWSRPC
jgi:type IV pilus biogenesis protein CpaD/CtpE